MRGHGKWFGPSMCHQRYEPLYGECALIACLPKTIYTAGDCEWNRLVSCANKNPRLPLIYYGRAPLQEISGHWSGEKSKNAVMETITFFFSSSKCKLNWANKNWRHGWSQLGLYGVQGINILWTVPTSATDNLGRSKRLTGGIPKLYGSTKSSANVLFFFSMHMAVSVLYFQYFFFCSWPNVNVLLVPPSPVILYMGLYTFL